ncbi:MAG: ComEC family competence protein [Flavobacteriales bacterium]|nr:ComEC family competence protein [Flavobacteriales bacterium]
MKVWNSFPMLRVLIPFLGGIVSWAFLLEEIEITSTQLIFGSVAAGLIALATVLFGSEKRITHRFGMALWPASYLIGSMLTISVSDRIFPDHLKSFETNGVQSFIAVVDDQPRQKQKSIEVVANVTDVDQQQFGKVILYFKTDSASKQIKYGDELLLRTNIQEVEALGNPNEFNYPRYLRFHYISHRGYVQSSDWKWLSAGNPSIYGWFLDLRSILIGKLKEAGLQGNELSVASALILGFRAELDRELMNAYAGAGATHVLAVSGLHVGIVYIILSKLLLFMDRYRNGRILKTVLLVFLLFSYAALTGFSPSVARAATMFSFVAIGKAMNRDSNIFNTLAVSVFGLVLYDPMIVMQVGFQLSYAAVIGIVLIQPKLVELIVFENRILDWAWSITCVSVAAQIGTFPLGLLYFHQFPILFPISNLLVIPAATLILYLGFSLFVVCLWQQALLLFGWFLKTVISILNQVVVWIEQIPYSVLSGIDISTLEALIIYGVISCFLIFVLQKQRLGFYSSLILAVIFMVMQTVEVYQQKNQQFLTVYNVRNETAIALVNGTDVTFLSSEELWNNESSMLFHIRHHWWCKGIENEQFVALDDSVFNRKMEFGEFRYSIVNLPQRLGKKVNLNNLDSLDFVVVHQVHWRNKGILEPLRNRSVSLRINGETTGSVSYVKIH